VEFKHRGRHSADNLLAGAPLTAPARKGLIHDGRDYYRGGYPYHARWFDSHSELANQFWWHHPTR